MLLRRKAHNVPSRCRISGSTSNLLDFFLFLRVSSLSKLPLMFLTPLIYLDQPVNSQFIASIWGKLRLHLFEVCSIKNFPHNNYGSEKMRGRGVVKEKFKYRTVSVYRLRKCLFGVGNKQPLTPPHPLLSCRYALPLPGHLILAL